MINIIRYDKSMDVIGFWIQNVKMNISLRNYVDTDEMSGMFQPSF